MPRAPFLFFLLTLKLDVTRAEINERNFSPLKIVTRDVAIIGGGASGTYAAVRLREDLNTSIVIIEPQNRLGGHVDTYTIPGTNTTIEYGVQSYMNYGPTPGFFNRFGVETVPFAARRLTTINVDITTGKLLTGYIPPSNNATTSAFQTWLQFLEKYESLVEPGFWNFPPPDGIPPEFLLPFGEFTKTHNVAAALPRIGPISGIGAGGFDDIPTIQMIQAFGPPITRAVLQNALIVPVVSNSLLYQRAYALLQPDVFLGSSVKRAERKASGVRLVVGTGDGDVLVKAKRVLWTPYPSHGKNLNNFDEDKDEAEVFGGWVPTYAFVGVLRVPCIPEDYSVAFIAPAAVPSEYLAIRDWPYTLRLDSTGPAGLNLFRVLFSANYSVTAEEVKGLIVRDIQNLVTVGTLNYTGECKVEYEAFANHNGVLWPRGKEVLESGFVERLNALQGRRGTWWTGRSLCGFYSSSVWAFTETVVQRMVEELRG